MIKINDLKYDEYDTKITWGDFWVSHHGIKRTGVAPFITYDTNDASIGLELTFSKEMFEDAKKGEQIDIKQYITDIIYDDEKGWISISDREFECSLTKITKKRFNINFHVLAYDLDEKFDIFIDDDIDIL